MYIPSFQTYLSVYIYIYWPKVNLYQVVVGQQSVRTLFKSLAQLFCKCFLKMATGSHFEYPKITFDHISYHFISIPQFLFLLIFFTKWPLVAILDVQKSLSIAFLELFVVEIFDILDWEDNVNYVKFEERSLNPSKVIALTTKLWRGGGRGGCVAD